MNERIARRQRRLGKQAMQEYFAQQRAKGTGMAPLPLPALPLGARFSLALQRIPWRHVPLMLAALALLVLSVLHCSGCGDDVPPCPSVVSDPTTLPECPGPVDSAECGASVPLTPRGLPATQCILQSTGRPIWGCLLTSNRVPRDECVETCSAVTP